MNDLNKAEVELIAVTDIIVGLRRRQKVKALASLKKSIAARGLIHPIVVRNGNQLVAGQRRLEAVKLLGWKQIPARRVERMTDDELRAKPRAEMLCLRELRLYFDRFLVVETFFLRCPIAPPALDLSEPRRRSIS